MKISELKKEAKTKLSETLPIALGITLIYTLMLGIMSFLETYTQGVISLIIAIFSTIISIPINYGIIYAMLKIFRGQEVEFIDFIKVGFQNFKRALSLYISMLIRLLIPLILVYVSLSLPQLFIHKNISFDTLSLIIKGINIIHAFCMIYFLYKTLSFILSTYLLVDNPDAQNKEILDKSSNLMKGNKLKFVLLLLSFLGWILLAAVIISLSGLLNKYFTLFVNLAATALLSTYISFTIIAFYEDLNETTVSTTDETIN